MKILFKSRNEDCFPKLHNLVIGVFFSEVKVPTGKRRGSSNFLGSHYLKIRSLPFPLPLGFVKKAVATTVAFDTVVSKALFKREGFYQTAQVLKGTETGKQHFLAAG